MRPKHRGKKAGAEPESQPGSDASDAGTGGALALRPQRRKLALVGAGAAAAFALLATLVARRSRD
jgi:hypothetical protein